MGDLSKFFERFGLIPRSGAEWKVKEARLLERVARLRASSQPILVGPWLSEVGYELLYWIPFLNWLVEEGGIKKKRLHIVSRGGAGCWYDHLSDHRLDVFDVISPEEYCAQNEKRWEAGLGVQKQKKAGEFDEWVVDAIRKRLGQGEFDSLHPSLMYQSFKPYWLGMTGNQWLENFTRFRSLKRDGLNHWQEKLGLPQKYVAVKIYFNPSFPKTEANQDFCSRLILNLSQHTSVVMLDTGLKMDDHPELSQRLTGERILYINDRLTPSKNLEQQTAIVQGASSFFGTYGGFSYLGSFLDIPSFSFYSNPELFYQAHLHCAHLAVRHLRAQGLTGSDFSAVDVNSWRHLPWATA